MAEILIKAVDAVRSDPEKDRTGCYKRGMPVVIMPDGHQWGAKEGLPKFYILKLPGVSSERVRWFIASDDIQDGLMPDGVTPMSRRYRARVWKIAIDDLPAQAISKLANDGELTIGPSGDYTWNQVRTFIKNTRTGESAPDTL